MTQYLDAKTLLKILDVKISPNDLIKTDTYHEMKLLDKLNEFKEDTKIQLLKCAIQIAIIGAGNKNYGKILHNGIEIPVADIFKSNNIIHGIEINARLKDDQLSARRLVRIFRYQIQKFIIESKTPSYLFSKYSDNNENYKSICFPGAEHLIISREEANYLLFVYHRLDQDQETNFCRRIKFVFNARKIPYDE